MNLQEKIDKLDPVKIKLKEQGFFTKKNLGQNFIFDLNITDKIVRSSGHCDGRLIFEVGPGGGSLTRSILKAEPAKVFALEKDFRCIEILSELEDISQGKLEVINQDALNFDYKKEIVNHSLPAKVIANLPYNISTELLFKWLDFAASFESLTLMFQKEVAERICAQAGDKQYGRVSVIASLLCERRILFEVSPTVFYPPPKVYSAVVHLESKKDIAGYNLKKIRKVTKAAFGQRRKSIKNSLKEILNDSIEQKLLNIGINPSERPENLSPQDFVKISEILDG